MGTTLTDQQKLFAKTVAETGSVAVAGRVAGYSRDGSLVARGSKVAAEIIRIQKERMATKLLPKALNTLDELMDHKIGMVRLGAAKAVLQSVTEQGLGSPEGLELHEMTHAQLQEALRKAEAEQARHGAEDAEIVDGASETPEDLVAPF